MKIPVCACLVPFHPLTVQAGLLTKDEPSKTALQNFNEDE